MSIFTKIGQFLKGTIKLVSTEAIDEAAAILKDTKQVVELLEADLADGKLSTEELLGLLVAVSQLISIAKDGQEA